MLFTKQTSRQTNKHIFPGAPANPLLYIYIFFNMYKQESTPPGVSSDFYS